MPRDHYNAFLHTDLEPITGHAGSLQGINIAVKDNIAVAGWPLTAASKILEGYQSPYDATVIKRLKEAGATLVGKTNLDEFAMGSSTENSAFGPTKNPWDESRVPGGSSGGSAAAVAADLCHVALGSDTGGSTRQPAAFCGVTGFKPTYGAVSRYGLVALASSLDVIGPIARSATDVEKVFAVIAGRDENDQTTFDYTYETTTVDWTKLRVGLPKELWNLSIDAEVKSANQTFVDWLRSKGATISEVSTPTAPQAINAYCVILPAEASANLSRYDGIRYPASVSDQKLIDRYRQTRALLGQEAKRRILLGTYVLSVGHYDEYYQLAVRVQGQIRREYDQVFTNVDVLINPTTPTPPFKFGEKAANPVAMYQSDLMTVPANLGHVPAISVPVGFTENCLPIGAQITANKTRDNLVIAIAKAYQDETDFHLSKPKGEVNG